MNQGKFVFSQVVEFIPRYQFDKLVKQYKGDWHAKNLNSYNHLLHLLFGQLTGCDSLRDICLCLEAHSKILYHLGFRNTVNHTSLSRANESRDFLGLAIVKEAVEALSGQIVVTSPYKNGTKFTVTLPLFLT